MVDIDCPDVALEGLDEFGDVVEWCISLLPKKEKLFVRAKERLLAQNQMLDLSDRNVCQMALTSVAHKYRIVPIAEETAEIKALTFDDMLAALEWISQDRRWSFVLRP